MRYTTAGESHGRALVDHRDGSPRRPAGRCRPHQRRSCSPPASATAEAAAWRSRPTTRRSSRACGSASTIGSPVALTIGNRDWDNWTDVMASAGEQAREQPSGRASAGSRRSGGRPEDRLRRRPGHPRARQRSGDRRARRCRRNRQGVPAADRRHGRIVRVGDRRRARRPCDPLLQCRSGGGRGERGPLSRRRRERADEAGDRFSPLGGGVAGRGVRRDCDRTRSRARHLRRG